MFSSEPCVACATATRPGTPQPPPWPQRGACPGLEIALAMTPPISKKLPPVAAVPMRKKRVSWAAAAAPSAAKSKLAQTMPRQPRRTSRKTVLHGETAMRDDTMPASRLQPRAIGLASPETRREATMSEAIDLRSDTVTRPSPAMRAAMAAAPVGDDQYGEDPSVNRLQERIAALLGKEAALFVASGTMANQIAVKLLTRPGEEVVVGENAHMMWHEAGAAAFRAALKPRGHIVFPPTALAAVENTHNLSGGRVFPQADAAAICAAAHAAGIPAYLDGARLFNAAVASGRSLAELAAPFDLVSVALSKGLGCPVGSVLAGTTALIAEAVTARRRFGGAMRQAGILAAAGLYALDHNLARLAEDHANARLLAAGIGLDPATIDSNIVVFRAADAAAVVAAAKARGVLISALGPQTVRAVTHLDVTAEQCRKAAAVLAKALGNGI